MQDSNPINVLCTSVGNDGFQAVLRALKSASEPVRVFGADAHRLAYGLYTADEGFLSPRREDVSGLLQRLLDICEKKNIHVLLPLSTEDQFFFALHKPAFEVRDVRVAVSSPEAVRISNHKHELLAFAVRRHIPVPLHVVVRSREEMKQALRDFQADRFPVVLKREFSTGAQGVKIVRPDLADRERLFARDNISITLDDLLRWTVVLDPFPPLMVSEYLDMRHSVDVFLDQGKARCAVVRTEMARLYGMSVAGEVVKDEAVEEIAVATAEQLGLSYTVNVEVGHDAERRPKLVEVNPRFPATIDHTVLAGCNMPLWTVLAALDRPYKAAKPVVGTRYVRHWSSVAPGHGWK